MSTAVSPAVQRRRFCDPGATPAEAALAERLLALLLAQDGSTTRLCETVAGGPVTLLLAHQSITSQVPEYVRDALPGACFIERFTSLAAHGEVMMDNLAYVALDGLAPDLRRDLEGGVAPIGHLLARMFVRRHPLQARHAAPALQERLWSVLGMPDAGASRAYGVITPEGPRMVIAETFRRGMLMDRRNAARVKSTRRDPWPPGT
jgi:chorismate-pyruvate lyase